MTNRVQILRSSTSGNYPAQNTRAVGETWINFPDLQFGVIDTNRAAQKLLAVRFFSQNANYSAGDVVQTGSGLAVAKGPVAAGSFNPAQWDQIVTQSTVPQTYVLPIATTSILGGVMVDGSTIKITGAGVISSIGGVAMGATPPVSPIPGTLWWDSVGGQLYVWFDDGSSQQWVVANNQNAGAFLSTGGGTIMGPLIINNQGSLQVTGGAVAIAASQPSNMDGVIIGANTPQPGTFTSLNGGPLSGFRNKLMNGSFRIDQRNGISAASIVVGSGYIIDRWSYTATVASKFAAQTAFGNMGALGGGGWLTMTSQAATAPAATDYYVLYQSIEGLNCVDLNFGTSSARTVVLSFMFYSSLTGTHSGSLSNKTGNRAYVFSWPYNTATTWQRVSVVIPGDQAGTWSIDNTTGLMLRFNLGSGTNFLAAANAWGTANVMGAAGSVQPCTVSGSTFVVGNVQLEVGPVATPFEYRPVGLELALCQRYYQRYTGTSAGTIYINGYNAAGGLFVLTMLYPPMRAVPTTSLIGTWTQSNCNVPTIDVAGGMSSVRIYASCTAAGAGASYSPANGGFDLTAEL